MTKRMRWMVAAAGLWSAGAAELEALEIPYFARKYDLPCSACHVSPPKLNAAGEAFRRDGYQLRGVQPRRTLPFAIWASGRSDVAPLAPEAANRVRTYINRVELISGGSAGAPWLSYFLEWRPVSLEARGDGTLRDRSGRFEDLFLTATAGDLSLIVGQFRMVDQVDVSLRPGLSEPLALAASLPGGGEGTARERSLRGFAPSARSPAVRLDWTTPAQRGWEWTTSLAVPFPGELSIPLTREARTEASNELEGRAKGVVAEAYLRRGLTSYGGHAFFAHGDRYLANLVATGAAGPFHWTGIAGTERHDGVQRMRWSAEGQYFPHYFVGFGARAENRTDDGLRAALLPYANVHFPGSRYTVRLTVEHRFQRDRQATAVEIGTVF